MPEPATGIRQLGEYLHRQKACIRSLLPSHTKPAQRTAPRRRIYVGGGGARSEPRSRRRPSRRRPAPLRLRHG